MSSSRPGGMRRRFQELCCILFLQWVLWELPVSSNAASSSFKSTYNAFNNLAQQASVFSQLNGRPHVWETSTLSHGSPSIQAIAPYTFASPAPSPSPLPDLFPSDPPVTIPYSPAPGILTIPTGNCSTNFTAIETILYQTAADCSDEFARYVGVAICCPQFESLLRIMQGQHISATGSLGFNNTEAGYCFVETVLNSGVNSTLCDVQPASLTVGTCPVTTMTDFELVVNTSSLLQACQGIDPLRECVLKTCQNEIGNATLRLAQGKSQTVDDCNFVVLSWLASRITPDEANSVFRFISSCSVNQVCPLAFSSTSAVAKACNSSAPSNVTCCAKLDQFVQMKLQSQMLITNEQAYKCANTLALDLQGQGVTSDIYALCRIHLSDFSLQAQKLEGCLLPSQPTDINITTGTPYFICDLNDNILAQWPSLPNTSIGSPSPNAHSFSKAPSLYNGWGLETIICAVTVISLLIKGV